MRRILVYALIFVIGMFLVAQPPEDSSEISTKMIHGVRHVYNPEKPKFGTLNLVLEKGLEIRADTLGDDNYFGIHGYHVDNQGNVYIFDNKAVQVYKFNNKGKLLTRFGSKGEGPAEFAYIYELRTLGQHAWVRGGNDKYAEFDEHGKYIREFKIKGRHRKTLVMSENKLLTLFEKLDETKLDKRMDEDDIRPRFQFLQVQDFSGNRLKVFFKSDQTGGWMSTWIRYYHPRLTPMLLFDHNQKDGTTIYVRSDEYKIHFLDEKGLEKRVWHRQFSNQKLTRKHIEEVCQTPGSKKLIRLTKRWKKDLKKLIHKHAGDRLCIIKDLSIRANGMICVYRLVGIEKEFELDIFNSQGEYVYTFKLPDFIWEHRDITFDGYKLRIRKYDDDADRYIEYKIINLPYSATQN